MDGGIQAARQVALRLLDPTESELEHGLELHRDAIVCESYGFAPRAAIDGDALREAIEAGATQMEVQDMIEDMMMTRFADDEAEREEFLMAWRAAGMTCILQNAGEECQDPLRLMRRLARFTYSTDMMDELDRAVTPDDIVAAKEADKGCLYMSGNAVPLAQDWISVEDELRYIRLFFQLGMRMMHLTYNRRNMIGDGCAEQANGGLSAFGRAVIAEMNRQGVIVDVAHAGWQTSLEAALISERPMVASHSCCLALNDHIRAKPDEVIRAIADTGGYIGICAVPAFLGGSGDIRAMLDHIDYAAKQFGVEHVAIGTDRAYRSANDPAERAKVPDRPERTRWEYFWPPDDPLHDPAWRQPEQVQSLAWTNWPLFTVGLVQRGYTDNEIRQIIGGNVLRVARAALAGRTA
jgi:membrane dipeptidase